MLKRKFALGALLFMLALWLACPALAAIEDDCGQLPCVCFLQEGDEGIAVEGVTKLLAAQGYLSKKSSTYTNTVTKAVLSFQSDRNLAPTGMMDDDTLTMLIFGITSDAFTEANASSNPHEIWVPVNGGKKRFPSTKKRIALFFGLQRQNDVLLLWRSRAP